MPPQRHMAFVEQAINHLNTVDDYIKVGMETTIDVTLDYVENSKDNDDRQVNKLRATMLDYVKMDRELEQFMAAVSHVKGLISDGYDGRDLELMLDEKLQEIQKGNDDRDLIKHNQYKELEKKIQETKNPDDDQNVEQTAGTSNDDDEIAMTQQEVNTKCPYTGKEMKIPMKNKLCNHQYDKEGILDYIKKRGKKAKCPVAGCKNDKVLESSALEEDKELKRYIERKNRQVGKKT